MFRFLDPLPNLQRKLLIGLLLVLVLPFFLPLGSPVHAETDLKLMTSAVDYEFGEELTFRARIDLPDETEEVWLFFSPAGRYQTESKKLNPNSRGQIVYRQDLREKPLPPFATIHFWYQAITENGDKITSASDSFDYRDNRFDWQRRGAGSFWVNWYEGDQALGQKVLDIALLSREQMLELISTSPQSDEQQNTGDRMEIFVYASGDDLRSALNYEGPSWVVGHADPEFNVVLVSLPPGPEQILEMERQIPHELAHLLLYQKAGPGYYSLPTWLNEGLATISELYPNPDFQFLLQDAFDKEALLPMHTLCYRFPSSAAEALLAYAQSASFTRYLNDHFGKSSIENLIASYVDGKTCEIGVQDTLGMPLSQAEKEWRRTVFGENAWTVALTKLLPFLLILALMVGPLVLVGVPLRRSRVPDKNEERSQE